MATKMGTRKLLAAKRPDTMGGMTPRPNKRPDTSRYRGVLGLAVRTRREQLGMSVEMLVARLAELGVEINQQTLYSYESGHRPIHVDHIPAFAAALKTTIKKLMPDA